MMPEGPPIDAPGDPYLGTIVADRYLIVRKLGQGGMGTVYLAQHTLIERPVALKILSHEFSSNQESLMRFLQEARAAARIGHENIVTIHDFGETSDSVFIAMEYLVGQDLAQLIRSHGPLPEARLKNIAAQICRAVGAAHDAGIIHRDLKPENVFLCERDDRKDVVKILDFGVAHGVEQVGPTERLTMAGMVVGTPEYMAPEQARGDPLDRRVDVYALGCILYEMLTGTPPFANEAATMVMAKHLLEVPARPSDRMATAVDPALEAICMRALEKDPARRFQSMQEFLEALQAGRPSVLSDPGVEVQALPGQGMGSPQRQVSQPVPLAARRSGSQPVPESAPAPVPHLHPRRRRFIFYLGAGAILALLIVLLPRQLHRPPRPEVPAPAPAVPVPAPAQPPQGVEAALPPAPPKLMTLPSPRLVATAGTAGALVLLNGRQVLGKTPLRVTVLMLDQMEEEAGFVLLRKAGCDDHRIDLTLRRGAIVDLGSEAGLSCQQRHRRASHAGRTKDAAPQVSTEDHDTTELRNPFGRKR